MKGYAYDYTRTNTDQALEGKFGDWLKKTGKKVVNVAQDVGRTVVNTVSKPVTIFTGDKIYDKEDFETKAFQKGAAVTEKISDFTNRYINPATILIRNGIIASLKLNVMGVAKKLRWAYLSQAEIAARKINPSELSKIKSKARELENIVTNQGGKAENVREAILTGKGNEDGKVPKDSKGLSGYSQYQTGLGEPATATAIAAAAAIIGGIAASLQSIKALFPGKAENDAFNQSSGPTPEQAALQQQNLPPLEEQGNNKVLWIGGGIGLLALGTIIYLSTND